MFLISEVDIYIFLSSLTHSARCPVLGGVHIGLLSPVVHPTRQFADLCPAGGREHSAKLLSQTQGEGAQKSLFHSQSLFFPELQGKEHWIEEKGSTLSSEVYPCDLGTFKNFSELQSSHLSSGTSNFIPSSYVGDKVTPYILKGV